MMETAHAVCAGRTLQGTSTGDVPPVLAISAHPELVQIGSYWHANRAGRPRPARDALDAFRLRAWLQNLMLLDTQSASADFRVRLFGGALVALFGTDLGGRSVADAPSWSRPTLRALCLGALRFGRPQDSVIVRNDLTLHLAVLPFDDGRGLPTALLGAVYEGPSWPTLAAPKLIDRYDRLQRRFDRATTAGKDRLLARLARIITPLPAEARSAHVLALAELDQRLGQGLCAALAAADRGVGAASPRGFEPLFSP
jgi:hypothetical protein